MKKASMSIAIFAMMGFSTFASAQEPGAMASHPCKKDVETLCKGIEHGDGRIAKCLKENESKLSAECKAKQSEMKEHRKAMHEACHDDVEKFCGEVKPGGGAIMKCMKEHKDQLSPACKSQAESMKQMRKGKNK